MAAKPSAPARTAKTAETDSESDTTAGDQSRDVSGYSTPDAPQDASSSNTGPTAGAAAATAVSGREALDATAAAVPPGTRDVNMQESTPRGPVQTQARDLRTTPPSASTMRARRTKEREADEETVAVHLKVNIPSMGHKKGDEAKLPKSFAMRLLADGDAITPAEAKALDEAERIRKDAEERTAKAQKVSEEQRRKAREAEVSAHAKAEAVRRKAAEERASADAAQRRTK